MKEFAKFEPIRRDKNYRKGILVEWEVYRITHIWEMLITLFGLFRLGVSNFSKWKPFTVHLKILYFSSSWTCLCEVQEKF